MRAKNGDTVKVQYTGRLTDGTVFDSSPESGPIQFTLGEGRLIQCFEQAVLGMALGESKTVEIPANEAYGPHDEDMVIVLDREEFPPGLELKVGQELQLREPQSSRIKVTVTEVSESQVTMDANHPLAGQDLICDIQLDEIVERCRFR
jgi:FKBP-type peptidyl-prolyl cis-trans isomerase 2